MKNPLFFETSIHCWPGVFWGLHFTSASLPRGQGDSDSTLRNHPGRSPGPQLHVGFVVSLFCLLMYLGSPVATITTNKKNGTNPRKNERLEGPKIFWLWKAGDETALNMGHFLVSCAACHSREFTTQTVWVCWFIQGLPYSPETSLKIGETLYHHGTCYLSFFRVDFPM